MAWLTLEVLGCGSHIEKLLRQRISGMCPASEISWAFTLVGERSLLLAIQFTREQHLAHIDGGELSFTADEVLTSSVGLGGSPRVLVHGRLAAPAAPLGNDCSRRRYWSFYASCLKFLSAHALQSCGFLTQYREAKICMSWITQGGSQI